MYRLGRRIKHDPRSLNFAAETAPVTSVSWEHIGPVLDQGDLGSCTANALAACLNTRPLWDGKRTLIDEQTAVAMYSWATHHDRTWGHWPPTDTGSSGLAACKAGKHLGFLHGYRHSFGLEHALGALSLQPVMIGIDWTEDMFTPDVDGFVRPTGGVAGGHEVALVANDAEGKYVTLLNSWGDSWGQQGRAKLTWDDLGALLDNDGDCTAPLVA